MAAVFGPSPSWADSSSQSSDVIDLPPSHRTNPMEVGSVTMENDGHEEESIH